MSHDITTRDVGRRVKAVSTHEDGTVVTVEGVVVAIMDNGTVLVGESDRCVVHGTSRLSSCWAVTVERLRPAVPTGLGAVVRLDGDGGPVADHASVGGDALSWYVAGCLHTDTEIAARIHDVLSEGWAP